MTSLAWDEIKTAAAEAPYPVRLLPADRVQAKQNLAALDITTNSWLGAVVAKTAGLLIDHGWLRVLGSGGAEGLSITPDPPSGRLIVGYDVLGGQFAWFPATSNARPTVHYFAPDNLSWQDLDQGYGNWLHAMLSGGLTLFYEDLRWPGWETEVSALTPSQGIHTWPPPWSAEGKDLATVSRRTLPITELVAFHEYAADQIS